MFEMGTSMVLTKVFFSAKKFHHLVTKTDWLQLIKSIFLKKMVEEKIVELRALDHSF
jgi:hypothetical protein